MKFLRTLLIAILAVGGIATILWFTSPYFRAWMKHPVAMYDCTKDLPSEICVGIVQLAELAKAGKRK